MQSVAESYRRFDLDGGIYVHKRTCNLLDISSSFLWGLFNGILDAGGIAVLSKEANIVFLYKHCSNLVTYQYAQLILTCCF